MENVAHGQNGTFTAVLGQARESAQNWLGWKNRFKINVGASNFWRQDAQLTRKTLPRHLRRRYRRRGDQGREVVDFVKRSVCLMMMQKAGHTGSLVAVRERTVRKGRWP